MSVTAGALTKVLVAQTTANLNSAAATSGTGPYIYQWYQSTTTGFTANAGSLVSGATAAGTNVNQAFSGLLPNTTYYFLVVATDTGAGNATSTSAQLTVLTEPQPSQNQFAQQPYVGVVDMTIGPTNVIACQADTSLATATNPQIYNGQAVKIVANTTGGLPKVVPITAKGDLVFGFTRFNMKDLQYVAGQNLEVCLWGTTVWLFATGAITQGAEVCADPTYVGGVQATGNTATYVGIALDGCTAAGLIRVMLFPNIAGTTA